MKEKVDTVDPIRCSSMVHYRPNSTQHYGTIECTAKNEVGIQIVPCKYHIIDSGTCSTIGVSLVSRHVRFNLCAGPPNFPFFCHLFNQSVTQVSIQCTSEKYTSNDVHTSQTGKSALQAQTVFVYPTTFYVAEVYDKTGTLVNNVTLPTMAPTYPGKGKCSPAWVNHESNRH